MESNHPTTGGTWRLNDAHARIKSRTKRIAEDLWKVVLVTGLLLPLIAGCYSPTLHPPVTQVTSGHKYTRTGLTFLDIAGTTRTEVLENLGPPSWELKNERIAAYLWQTTTTYGKSEYVLPIPYLYEVPLTKEEKWATSTRWGLFIAFDEHQLVSRHEICRLGNSTPLDEDMKNWLQKKPNPPNSGKPSP